jgi:gliding motility-associated-like protein
MWKNKWFFIILVFIFLISNQNYANTDCSKPKINKSLFANIAPIITASGDQSYCPGTSLKIVTDVTITDADDTSTDAIYIQISTGYINGQDLLTLTGLHPLIITTWNSIAGKLKLSSPINGAQVSYTDFIAAIKDVEFSNSSTSPSGTRDFSISIGQANYLPRNGHYYEFVPNIGISWTDAKNVAKDRDYYGLQGYLTTVTAADEAQLAGAQALGAGWIGGTDAENEGVWKWVTGPEGLANGGTGTIFWNGQVNGTSPNFAFWNDNEPNQFEGAQENYTHVTAPGVGNTGSWNDLTNTGDPSGPYQPKGYIVEYGGMPGDPILNISASTTITMSQITTTNPSPICASATAVLQASTTTGTINWYNELTGGTYLGTGNSFTTPPLFTTTTYYVDNGCSPRTAITVTVESLPIANAVLIPRQCDDNHDGKFTFNTVNLESTLVGIQTNVTVTYFDQDDNPLKDANGDFITSPFPTSFSTTSQTIKAIVANNTSLTCSSATSIDFIVDDLPEAFAVPITLTTTCDDEPNPVNQDGKFAFDTSTFEATILGGQTGMTVTYTLQDGTVLSTLAPTFTTATQNVLVTVTNPVNTNCTATTTLSFVVNPLPIVNDVTIIQCDTDLISDGKTLFNLTVKNNEISINYTNENFTYYTSQSGANSGGLTDLILNNTAFENPTSSEMDIWSRVANKITGCFSVAKLTLKVPTTNLLPSYKITVPPVCDDFLDTNGNNNTNNDNRDGIATFDFSWTKATILSELPTTTQGYTINYYKNKVDALAQLNVIADISNYRNIDYPSSHDIWVRVESSIDNSCVGLGPYITLNVEALPFANPVIIPRQCDDDQDGTVTFDTRTLESDLLNGQSLSDVTVTYFDPDNNPLKDANGILIPSPFPSSFTTTSQTIKAVVTNNSSLQCFDATTIVFIVDDLPQAFQVATTLTTICDDEQNPLEQDGQFAFDTTTFETTILGGQTGMTVKYQAENGAVLPSPLPNPFVTGTQNVTVLIENPINTSCTATVILPFKVNPLPKINLNTNGDENELVCSNLPTFFVQLDAGIQDGTPTNNYTYLWSKDGIILTANTAATLPVNSEGIYTVEVLNSFGCSSIRTIKVTSSDIATIESIDITDLNDVNTVTVNVIGRGNYEYSLNEPSGYFQSSNFFSNVPAGIHEVFINDINGCGLISKTIAVIGAPKFFTPNNDGYNDYWSIKGVDATFNSKSIIYIFDRYGKLLKQWIPNLDKGWDGTFNGRHLPSDDYWFTLQLEDGRATRGHFSLKR